MSDAAIAIWAGITFVICVEALKGVVDLFDIAMSMHP
jgi:hypothetical protein